jgi:hypothetical protein
MPVLSAADRAGLQRALDAGFQPRASGTSRGLIVSVPREGLKHTYRTLIDRNGEPTPAGTFWFAAQPRAAQSEV